MTTLEQIPAVVENLRAGFQSERTRPLEWRFEQLRGVERLLQEREHEILEALYADVGKPTMEAYLSEVGYVTREVNYVQKHLAKWTKAEKIKTPVIAQPGKSLVLKEPLGVVLIIGPWNYPFHLVMAPLVGALAAGNCVAIKPSEVAPRTSALLARWLPEYLDPQAVAVIEGGVAETTELLKQRYDHIFYTGNGHVGRIVMEAAAKHLTPVTLELGGKSPCILDEHVDLEVAVRRIVWGKFVNAGQTCVAPDYILAHEAIYERAISRIKATIFEFYGENPQSSPDYARIVNARHWQRLMKLVPSGEVVCGGTGDESQRYLAPTVLRNVPTDSLVMQDEIFGPILPVLPVQHMEQAIQFVNERPKPLALYVFTSNDTVAERVLHRTSSGAANVNHVWMHMAVPGLPFGGVGASGMGAYHGKHTFDTFTHRKAVLHKPTSMDPPLMYPPYTDSKSKWLRRLSGITF
jgi:aldehyde dehydrogenase (NAD+)